MKKLAERKYWWGWLLWIPFSIALGLYGTTLQGGRYNVNQFIYIIVLPCILIHNARLQKKGEPTIFFKMVGILMLVLFLWGLSIAYLI